MDWFVKSNKAGLLAVGCVLVAFANPLAADSGDGAKSVVVYSNNFEKSPGTEWSNQKTDVTPKGRRRFLGQFCNDVVSLRLKNLPEHKYLRISLELFIIRSWDGNDAKVPRWGTIGPDSYKMAVEGGPTLLNTTFCMCRRYGDRQAFPDQYPTGHHLTRTAAAENNTLGFLFGQEPMDATYSLSFVFAHSVDSINLFFSGSKLQSVSDESWGLDNVKVEAFSDEPNKDMTSEQLGQLWKDLAGTDPTKAFEAIWQLVGAGDKAVELLNQQLDQVGAGDEKPVAELIQQLDDREWPVREKATRELTAMGKVIEPILRQTLESEQPPEVRFRIREILKTLSTATGPAHPVCFDRAIRVLEAVASRRAWEVLEQLSSTARFPSARDKAKAVLARLTDRLVHELLLRAEAKTEAGELETAKKLPEVTARTSPGPRLLQEIRKILTKLPQIEHDSRPDLPVKIRTHLISLQPDAGDALLAIIADPKDTLNRRATNALIKIWDQLAPEQIDAYLKQSMECYLRHRPRYPQGIKAYIGIGYRIRHGWGGWPEAEGFTLRTVSTRYLDGQPHGQPFSYQGPMASAGGIRVDGLDLGQHSVHIVTKYQAEYKGRKYNGVARSKKQSFEILPAHTPDHLAAPEDLLLDRLVHQSLRILEVEGTVRGRGPERNPWEPQISWKKGDGTRGSVHVPIWKLTRELPIDLCFDVEFHLEGTGEVFPGDPMVVLKGKKGTGYFSPYHARKLATGREGFVPVRIVLKPSRARALSHVRVTKYYTGIIVSEVVRIKVNR